MRPLQARSFLLALGLLLGAGSARAESSDRWRAIARLPRPVITKAVAALSGRIYFISGVTADGPTSAVTAYDIASRRWISRASSPEMLYNQDAAVLDGLIYIAGGCVRGDLAAPSASVYAYDPKEDSWSLLPSLPEPVYDAVSAAIGGRFVVIGGVSDRVTSRRVYAYSPKDRSWSQLADLPSPRSHAAGAMFGGKFFLTGGCGGRVPGRWCDEISRDVFVFDPKTGAWSSGPALPKPLHAHGAAVEGGRLVLAGGGCVAKRASDCGTVTLAAGSKRWRRGPEIIHARFGARLFALDPGIGLFGPNSTNNPEDLVEALGAPGPFLEPDRPSDDDGGARH